MIPILCAFTLNNAENDCLGVPCKILRGHSPTLRTCPRTPDKHQTLNGKFWHMSSDHYEAAKLPTADGEGCIRREALCGTSTCANSGTRAGRHQGQVVQDTATYPLLVSAISA
jgi:hypothetical protein